MKKVFISTSSFGQYDSTPLKRLVGAQLEHVLNPLKRTLTTSELINYLDGVDYLIAGTEKITKDVFQQRPQLRVISRCGSGMDSVDLAAAQQKDVQCLMTSDAPVQSVAELKIAYLKIQVLKQPLLFAQYLPALAPKEVPVLSSSLM